MPGAPLFEIHGNMVRKYWSYFVFFPTDQLLTQGSPEIRHSKDQPTVALIMQKIESGLPTTWKI